MIKYYSKIEFIFLCSFGLFCATNVVCAIGMFNTKSVQNGLGILKTITETKTVHVNGVLQSKTVVVGTANIDYSINHKVGMISGGTTVNAGEDIVFNYEADIPSITLSSNGSFKSGYTEFRNNVSTPLGTAYVKKNGLSTTVVKYPFYTYASSESAKTSMSSNNPSIMSCVGMVCHANSIGSVTITATIGESPTMYEDVTVFSSSNSSYFKGVYNTMSKTVSWTITVQNLSPIDASCGSASGNYMAKDYMWRVPACNLGKPDTDITKTPFLSNGETKTWNCIGSGIGHKDAPCSATRAIITYPCINKPINATPCPGHDQSKTPNKIWVKVEKGNCSRNAECQYYVKSGTATSIEDEQKNSNYIESRP